MTPPEAAPETAQPSSEASAAAEPPFDGPTWEDDETGVTLLLRALFALVAGGLLLWSQWHSEAAGNPGALWREWVWLAVLANFVMPLGVVWLFFGQTLRTPEWIKNPRHNAWGYGWNWRALKRHLAFGLLALLVMLPLLWLQARDVSAREFYRNTYLPPMPDARAVAGVVLGLVVYLFCWEWFFRGFLLFGMAQGVGAPAAIVLQAALFMAAHAGKPAPEVWSSGLGGLILGVVAWREKSFVPAFCAHALIHLAWLALLFR